MSKLINLALLVCLVFSQTTFVSAQATDSAPLSPDEMEIFVIDLLLAGVPATPEAIESALGEPLPAGFDIAATLDKYPELKEFIEVAADGEPVVSVGGEAPGLPEGSLACFDYYTFGSVDIQIANQAQAAVTGVPVVMDATLTNENPYPLVDGLLYIKIFREREDNVDTQINGDHIVDAFIAAENLVLAAGEEETLTFEWTPPSTAPAGNYYAAGYFVTAERFNMAGLSFTDDIIGGKGGFALSSDAEGVYFSKEGAALNGVRHQFIAAAPRFSADEPVYVSATIVNDADEDRTVFVDWSVFAWDAIPATNRLMDKQEAVVVPANGYVTVEYVLTDKRYAVYLIEPTITFKNEVVSKLNVRFVREGIDHLRINFPAVDTYPLRAGEAATLFSCLHNGGTDHVVDGSKLTLTLKDKSGTTVHEYVYEGPTTGAMMGVGESFTPATDMSDFSLTAVLTHNGAVVDEVTFVYRCEDIDERQCVAEAVVEESADVAAIPLMYIFIALAALFILGVGAFTYFYFRPKPAPQTGPVDDGFTTDHLNNHG